MKLTKDNKNELKENNIIMNNKQVYKIIKILKCDNKGYQLMMKDFKNNGLIWDKMSNYYNYEIITTEENEIEEISSYFDEHENGNGIYDGSTKTQYIIEYLKYNYLEKH